MLAVEDPLSLFRDAVKSPETLGLTLIDSEIVVKKVKMSWAAK